MDQDDLRYFRILQVQDESELSKEEKKHKKLLLIIVQIKNGNYELRKEGFFRLTKVINKDELEFILFRVLSIIQD